jgi:UrcA family protein
MDTINPSPKLSSSKAGVRAPSILAIALAAGVAVWLTAFGAELASAQTPQTTVARVTYSDLDLATSEGAHALLGRINVAARDACDSDVRHSPLFPRAGAEFQACVTEAVGTATSKLDARLIAAIKGDTARGSVSLAAR